MYDRQIRDANFDQVKAFPAANASNSSDGFDLEMVKGGAEPHLFECEVRIPAMPANTDNTKVSTVKLQDSADGSSWADTDPLIQTSITGVTSTGSLAKTVRFRLPSTARRYIRLTAAVPTGAGDNTAVSYGFALLF
jgi:hypothetical protein